MTAETIFALASGSMRAGVAVIRVSGPAALKTFATLTGDNEPTARVLKNVTLKDGPSVLDHALAVFFKAPASFTGEDVAEYHVHGGCAVIDGVLTALGKISGCRLAEPGEFTRRAFENGKMDLTGAEAVADLVAAETEAQKELALQQMGGALSRLYGGWAERLTKTLAHQEADIEFPDEDMPKGVAETLRAPLSDLIRDIAAHLDDNRRGERLREGLRIAIIGAPNAGKSSLLNVLAARDVAIVSPEAGTTRDIIDVHLNLGGYPVIITDTAGLRETQQAVEAEGIRRAHAAAEQADLKLALFDASLATPDAQTQRQIDDKTIVVLNKTDLLQKMSYPDAIAVSTATQKGLDLLLQKLTQKIKDSLGAASGPTLTRQRHRAALEEALASLRRSQTAFLPELAAEDMRLALRAIGRITGNVGVDDILDRVFKDFCIGK